MRLRMGAWRHEKLVKRMAIALIVVALLCSVGIAVQAQLRDGTLRRLADRLFGPPAVTLAEAHVETREGPVFDHSSFSALLKKHVNAEGCVDYRQLEKDADRLDEYVATIAEAPFDDLGRHEKLALLINAYNAFTLRLILDYWGEGRLQSIKDIPASKRWKHTRWRVGPYTWSLNEIEHEQVRKKFKEPRIHFALVCAARGCPRLLNEAYVADRLETQLEDQAKYVHADGRWFRFDADKGQVYLTKLYDWYGDDFKQVSESVLHYAARYSLELKRNIGAGHKLITRWLAYDWQLNRKIPNQ